jgi:hypothetical protein
VSGPVRTPERGSELQPRPPASPLVADRPCRACQRPLIFAPNVDGGKMVPIDIRTPTYFVVRDDRAPGGRFAWTWREFFWRIGQMNERDTAAAMSQLVDVEACGPTHFATCSHARDFSGAGKVVADHRRRMTDALKRVADLMAGPARTVGPAECRQIAELCLAAAENRPEGGQ